MKKVSKSLSFVVMTLLLVSLLASPGFSGIKFGVKGGFSLANLAFDPEPTDNPLENKTGAVGGFSMNLRLSRVFSLQPEILYVQKGTKITITEGEGEMTGKLNVDYLEIPLLLNISFAKEGSSFVPSVFAGPYVGLNTRAKIKSSYGGESYSEDFKDSVKDTDFGLAFGVGLGMKVGSGKIVLDVRYDLGLTNVADGMDEGGSVKNRAWLFMLGYCF